MEMEGAVLTGKVGAGHTVVQATIIICDGKPQMSGLNYMDDREQNLS